MEFGFGVPTRGAVASQKKEAPDDQPQKQADGQGAGDRGIVRGPEALDNSGPPFSIRHRKRSFQARGVITSRSYHEPGSQAVLAETFGRLLLSRRSFD